MEIFSFIFLLAMIGGILSVFIWIYDNILIPIFTGKNEAEYRRDKQAKRRIENQERKLDSIINEGVKYDAVRIFQEVSTHCITIPRILNGHEMSNLTTLKRDEVISNLKSALLFQDISDYIDLLIEDVQLIVNDVGSTNTHLWIRGYDESTHLNIELKLGVESSHLVNSISKGDIISVDGIFSVQYDTYENQLQFIKCDKVINLKIS